MIYNSISQSEEGYLLCQPIRFCVLNVGKYLHFSEIKFESKLYGSKSAVKIEEKYILSKTPVNE